MIQREVFGVRRVGEVSSRLGEEDSGPTAKGMISDVGS